MRKNARVIIAPEYLVKLFRKHRNVDIFIGSLCGFCVGEAECVKYYLDRIEEAKAMPDQPGKQGAIEVWEHLLAAYRKMSVFERSRLRRELPKAMAEEIKRWKK
jgi:hypothetical protein